MAVYTSAYKNASPLHGVQAQSLAYSLDGGFTWKKYAGNPVLNRNSANFRDPKVFRYDGGAGCYWVMVAVEATDYKVVLYKSEDLKNWELPEHLRPRKRHRRHLGMPGPVCPAGGRRSTGAEMGPDGESEPRRPERRFSRAILHRRLRRRRIHLRLHHHQRGRRTPTAFRSTTGWTGDGTITPPSPSATPPTAGVS